MQEVCHKVIGNDKFMQNNGKCVSSNELSESVKQQNDSELIALPMLSRSEAALVCRSWDAERKSS